MKSLNYAVDGRELSISIKRSRRKSLALHAFGDHSAEIRAPLNCPNREIEAFADARLGWLLQALNDLSQRPVARKPGFGSGDLRPYLGHQYWLTVLAARPRGVVLDGYQMIVKVARPEDEALVKKTIYDWYRAQATALFADRIIVNQGRFDQPIPLSGWHIRRMSARWGSCSSRGNICLNSLLVEHSLAAVDFVITHELCHLFHFNHDRAFYRLMDQVMPDWQEREALLK